MVAEASTITRGKELLEKMSPALRRHIEADAGILEREIETRRKQYPSKDFVPNVGQERALQCLKRPHETYGDYPHGIPITGGNGCGKTGCLAIVLAGIALGPEFLHPTWFGDHQYFRDVAEIRKQRVFYVRIVCDAADVTESGSVYQQIKKWIPCAEFTDKSGGYYSRVHIPSPNPALYHAVAIDVKTHNQSIIAHAGPDLDAILFNEPSPKDIFGENEGRLRLGGRWMAFLTPLHMASYLYDVVKSGGPDGEIVHTTISIWDNCADIPGNRGILARSTIEKMIRQWRIVNPLEVTAREQGKFMFLAGAVFSVFSERVHVTSPEAIDPSWQILRITDPHPKKPHVSVWLARDKFGYIRVIAEYPTEPWEHLNTTPLSLRHFGDEFHRIERGQNPQFPFARPLKMWDRLGDPNAMKATNPKTARTLLTEYEDETGDLYRIDVDNSVDLRHNKIRDLLFYNPQLKIDAINSPRLFFFDWCRNSIAAMNQFRYRQQTKQGEGTGISDKVEPLWEDFIDAIGYGVVLFSEEPYAPGSSSVEMQWEDGGSMREEYGDVVFTQRYEAMAS